MLNILNNIITYINKMIQVYFIKRINKLKQKP